MKVKKLNVIRGWFPQDLKIRSQVLAPQKKPKGIWVPIENIVAIPVIVAGVAAIFLLSNSWIKYMLIGSALVLGIAMLLLWGKTTIRRAVKFGLVGIMVFALCFSAFEGYLFWNSGYPPTYSQSNPDWTVSMPSLANLSVTELVHSVEASPTFSLLELEHGTLAFDSMSVQPARGEWGGYIEVNFFSETDHEYFHFYSNDGHPFTVEQMTYSGQRLAQQSIGGPVEASFSRIDEVGLYKFYRQALQLAQNRTSDLPRSLSIAVAYAQSTNMYGGGLTVQLIGSHELPDPKDGAYDHGVLISEFSPDGTLMYMPWPVQE